MKSQITRNLPNNQYLAAINANAPTGANPFATIADIPAPAVTLYSGDGTIGSGRIATLTDSLQFAGATGTVTIGAGAIGTAKLTINGINTTVATLNQQWRNSALGTLMTLNDGGQLGINTIDWTSGVGGITTHFAVRAQNGDTGYHTLGFFENTLTPTVNNGNGNRTLTASAKKLGAFTTYEVTGEFNSVDNLGAGGITEFYGSRSYVLQRGAGSAITYGSGYYSDKQVQDGSVNYLASFIADCTSMSGGSVTNLVGLYVKTPVNISAGTRTNTFGVYIEPNTSGTNNYGVIVGGTQTNAFGTNTPNQQALLELSSTQKAFLTMRMTAAQASAITPSNGMSLYVTNTNGTFTSAGNWYYQEGAWVSSTGAAQSWASTLAVGNTSGANNVIINAGQSLTVPLIYGGTAVGSFIDHISTTAAGTTTGLAWRLNGGNNGATNIVNIYNDGQYLIGTTVRNPTTLGTFRIGQGTSTIDIGEVSAGIGTIWLSQATPSTTNYTLNATSTLTRLNNANTVSVYIANGARIAVTATQVAFTPGTASSGSAAAFLFTAAASTGQSAGLESTTVNWNLSATLQHAGNTLIATQRDVVIQARTHTFATAGGVITDAVTWAAAGGPIAGTNATITNNHAIRIASNNVSGAGTTTNSYGLTVSAQTGATNNYVAQFLGGNTGFKVTAPTAVIHIGAGTATASTAPLKLTSSGTGLTGLLTVVEAGAVEFTTYGMWITNTAAVRQMNWMGLVAQAAPATNAIGVILDYYGTSPTRVLTTPDTFFSITGNDGQIYKVPGYI